MATFNLGKVITDQQKAILDRVSYNSTDNQLETSVNLAPKTLEQQEANLTYDIMNYSTDNASATCENIYSRFTIINNVLYIICNFKIINNTTASQTIHGINTTWLDLRGEYASKIVDLKGKLASETISSTTPITMSHALAVKNLSQYYDYTTLTMVFQNVATANVVSISFAVENYTTGAIVLEPNEEIYISGRMALTLI